MFAPSPAFLKQLWLTCGASLAFLLIGLVRGFSSSAIPSMEEHDAYLVQTSQQKSWIGAIPPLGAVAGSVASGPLLQRAGRRGSLQLAAPLWAAAWLLLALARSYPVLLVARLLTGFCVGLVLAAVQVYVGECCDPEVRGRLGSLPTLAMSAGILLSYVAGSALYWKHLAYLSTFFCALLFVALLPLPESPVWLSARGRDAAPAVAWLRLSPRATAAAAPDQPEKAEVAPSLFSRRELCSARVLRPLGIGLALLFFQQFSGIDAVIFFTVDIFKSAGSRLDAMTATIVVGAVQLGSNAGSALAVDRCGRRPLLLLSAAGMCAAMAAMGAAFYCRFPQDSWLGYLPVASLVAFVVSFSVGFGGVPFLLLGELFPARHRSPLSAAAAAANLLAMFTVIKTYHSLQWLLTSAGTFWMYAGCCAAAFVFVLVGVPETRGRSLAEIEQHFAGAPPPQPPPATPLRTLSQTVP